MTLTIRGLEGLRALAGKPLGTSDWLTVEQDRIDGFARSTDDHQWIHVDPVKAADGPYGRTIAHGYLTLALVPRLLRGIYTPEDFSRVVNYGTDRVRFPAPVRCGSRVRGAAELLEVTELPGAAQARIRTTVEIEGEAKPACVAETLSRYYA